MAKKLAKFQQPREFQALVDVRKREHSAQTVASLARELVRHKRAKHRLEQRVKVENIQLEALSQLLVERLEGEEFQKVNLRSGVTVYLAEDVHPAVQDRPKLFAWIKQTRQVELLTVHHQTLRALTRELLAAGRALPPGVAAFLKTTARCRGLGLNGEDS